MKSKEELKKLFENGDKPTQEEFWEWQDSYWHKGEKLPIETAGLYKIKGSVPDKTALDTMTSMEEGDVYNLLDTGDNYVYVLNLNNTGSAGWDKLSGIVNLSDINLQTVLDNGSSATSPNAENLITIDIVNGIVSSSLSDSWSGLSSTLNQSPAYISFDSTQNNGNPKGTSFNQTPNFIVLSSQKDDLNASLTFDSLELLKYNEDYSSRYTDRTLVDKAYVDTAIATTPSNTTLQSVLENGSTATASNSPFTQFKLNIATDPTFEVNIYDDNNTSNTSFSQNYGGIGLYYTYDGIGSGYFSCSTGVMSFAASSTTVSITLTVNPEEGLVYDNDYSSRFTDRSLVDKAYVDLALSSIPSNATLQSVLSNGSSAQSGNNMITLDVFNNAVNFAFDGADANSSASSVDTNAYGTSITHSSGTGSAEMFIAGTDGSINLSCSNPDIPIHSSELISNPDKISFKQKLDSSVVGIDIEAEGISFEGLELTTNDSYPIVVIDPATGKLYYRML